MDKTDKIINQLVEIDFQHKDMMWTLGWSMESKGGRMSTRFFMRVIHFLLGRIYDLEEEVKELKRGDK